MAPARAVQHHIVMTPSGREERVCMVSEHRHGSPECGGNVLDCGLVWKCQRCGHEDLTVRGHRQALRDLMATKRPEIDRLKHGVTTADRPDQDGAP